MQEQVRWALGEKTTRSSTPSDILDSIGNSYLQNLGGKPVFATSGVLVLSSRKPRQILKRRAPFIDNLVESVGWSNSSNDDLITSRCQTFERRIGEFINGHTEFAPFLNTDVVVEFRFDFC